MTKKSKSNVPAVTSSASLAAKAFARIEKAAQELHATETGKRRERSLQLVSGKGGFSALIKSGNVTIQIENDEFAVSTSD